MRSITALIKLRRLMTKKALAAYIIPECDAHSSGFLGHRDKRRGFLSGFVKKSEGPWKATYASNDTFFKNINCSESTELLSERKGVYSPQLHFVRNLHSHRHDLQRKNSDFMEVFLDPKNDYAFKKIFGNEKHKNILMGFLNDLLPIKEQAKIINLKLLPNALDAEIPGKKESFLDILCTDEEGKKYIVEMQVAKEKGFEKRAQYYVARAFGNQMKRKEQYHELKGVALIAILDFKMFPKKEAYKSDHVILDLNTHERDLKELSWTFVELPKFKKTKEALETNLEKWCYFFKNASKTNVEELSQIMGDNNVIGEAYKALVEANWTQDELLIYELERKKYLDSQAALEAAKDEGMQKVARAMLKKKIDLSLIIEVTGLSEQEINKDQI